MQTYLAEIATKTDMPFPGPANELLKKKLRLLKRSHNAEVAAFSLSSLNLIKTNLRKNDANYNSHNGSLDSDLRLGQQGRAKGSGKH